MKKFLVVLLLQLSIFASSFSKNVFIVYDDSKSMNTDNRIVYANYAIQTLVSLLDKDDKITISYMSDSKNDFKNLKQVNMENISDELVSFQKNYSAKSNITPYSSVVNLANHIEKTSTSSEENWFVIITDGQFEDGAPIPNSQDFQEKLPQIRENTKFKPIFLVIGKNDNETSAFENQEGVQIFKKAFGTGEFPMIFLANGKNQIVSQMQDIAKVLSNKSLVENNNLFKTDGKKLDFSPQFKLKDMLVLSQETENEKLNEIDKILVNGVETAAENVMIPQINENGLSLKGNITKINFPGMLNIGDKVEIFFKEDIGSNVVKLLPNVELGFDVKFFDINNNEVTTTNKNFSTEDKLRVEARLVNKNDNSTIPYETGIKVNAEYGNEKIPLNYDEIDSKFTTNIDIQEGKNSLVTNADYPGYFNYQSDILTIEGSSNVPAIPLNLILETPKDVNINYDNLNYVHVYFIPKFNGKGLTQSEIDKLQLNIETDVEGRVSQEAITVDGKTENGWVYRVRKFEGINRWDNPEGVKNFKGTMTGEITEKPISAEIDANFADLSFFDKFWPIISTIFGPFLLAILIFGYIKKHRFTKNAKLTENEKVSGVDQRPRNHELKPNIAQRLLPYYSHSTSVRGITIKAYGNAIEIPASSLASRYDNDYVDTIMINSVMNSREELRDKAKKKHTFKISNGNQIEVTYKDGREIVFQYKK